MGQDRLRIGVLLSGSGTSLENLCERIDAGEVPGEVCVVISSQARAFGLERARRRGIPACAVPRREHPDPREFNDRLHEILARHGVEFVALLGFLSPFETRGRFDGRCINVHPALLPAFGGPGMYGKRVHEAVLAAGVKESGCTVHLVDEEYDRGEILAQARVPVLPEDTVESLAARVLAEEHKLLPRVVLDLATRTPTLDPRS